MRRLAGLGAALLALTPALAAAHSLLLESAPAAGATVSAPAPVMLRFNNRVEKPLSRLRLLDARGAPVALPAPDLDGAPDRLQGRLPALVPGRYVLEWQVLSTDGHVVTGRVPFRIAP